jgi:hypothetical protein
VTTETLRVVASVLVVAATFVIFYAQFAKLTTSTVLRVVGALVAVTATNAIFYMVVTAPR